MHDSRVLSRRDADPDDFEEDEGDMMWAEMNPAFGLTKDRSIWSYKLPLGNIDDYQISLPNPNQLSPSREFGWTFSKDRLFIRVNLSPGPENEATLFISFTKPCMIFIVFNIPYRFPRVCVLQ